MTDADRMTVWLREALDTAQREAEAAARAFPAWEFDERVKEVRDVPNAGTVAFIAVPQYGPHIARQSPAAVLRRIAKGRELLDDILTEQHTVVCDPFYTCEAATEERDGGANPMTQGRRPCDCGLDARVERRVRLLAECWGWTEEEQR